MKIDQYLRMITYCAKYYRYFIARNGVVEIRALGGTNNNYVGYFKGPEAHKQIMEAIGYKCIKQSEDGTVRPIQRPELKYNDVPRSGECKGYYYALNAVDPNFYALSADKIKRAKTTVSDANIINIRHILIDSDPTRIPSEISSSIPEKRASGGVIKRIIRWLNKRGLKGYLGDSGNGYHFIIPVNYSNTPENVEKVHTILTYLNKTFSTSQVSVDTVVYNPGRISKLYGTWTMKGSDIPERPHRYSNIHFREELPDQDVFEALKNDIDFDAKLKEEVSPTPLVASVISHLSDESKRDFHIRNITHILDKNSIIYRIKDKAGRQVFELKTCCVHTDHDGDEYECSIIVEPDGQYSGHCFHNDAFGWADFKAAIHFDDYKLNQPTADLPMDEFDMDMVHAFLESKIDLCPTKLIDEAITKQLESDSPSSTDVFQAMIDSLKNRPEPPPLEAMIPAAGLFYRKCVTTIAGDQGTGKSTFMVAGILMPMLRGEVVIGQYKMNKFKTFYVQSDNDEGHFMNRIVKPYGYDKERDFGDLTFFHTLNNDLTITVANIIGLITKAAEKGYDLIVLDNKSSLFPGMVYDLKNANTDSLKFVEALKKVAMKYNVAVVVVEHMRKRVGKQWDLVSIHDVLGSGTKTVEQCLGLNARYDEIKKKERGSKPEYFRRDGEGIVFGLKNAEGLDRLQYNIIKDEPYSYLSFDSYKGTIEKVDPDFVNGPSTESENIVKNFLCNSPNFEFTYGDLIAETRLSNVTVHKVIQTLAVYNMVNVDVGKGGRGHKTKIRVLDKKRIFKDIQQDPPSEICFNDLHLDNIIDIL